VGNKLAIGAPFAGAAYLYDPGSNSLTPIASPDELPELIDALARR